MNGLGDTYWSSTLPGKTLGKLDNSGHTRASRLLFRNGFERTVGVRAERVRDRPIVDKPAAVAKAPFGEEARRVQRVVTSAITKRNLLTLAKDSMAGIISDIVIQFGETSSGKPHDGGRWRTRVV